jgi:hypothetical protein
MNDETHFDEINDETGFANGNPFVSERQVRAYFEPANQRRMFGADAETDEDTLDLYAETVIGYRLHCAF